MGLKKKERLHLTDLSIWLQGWMCPWERGRKSLMDPIIFGAFNPESSNWWSRQPNHSAGGDLAWARERPKARRENLLNDPNHPDHDLHLGWGWSGTFFNIPSFKIWVRVIKVKILQSEKKPPSKWLWVEGSKGLVLFSKQDYQTRQTPGPQDVSCLRLVFGHLGLG